MLLLKKTQINTRAEIRDIDMADLNFTAEIAGLKARNAELIQKIAEDEANLNQESFEKEFRPRRGTPRTVRGQIKSQIDQF